MAPINGLKWPKIKSVSSTIRKNCYIFMKYNICLIEPERVLLLSDSQGAVFEINATESSYFLFHAVFFLVKTWPLHYPQCNPTADNLVGDLGVFFFLFLFGHICSTNCKEPNFWCAKLFPLQSEPSVPHNKIHQWLIGWFLPLLTNFLGQTLNTVIFI